ncbi:hypothetical protein MIB92_08085 [Aestuariirhabdus sp. Z084]|uniref:hypothetical protein n=1 Tax=Aestuariirhabdus haliotis TaxID=2918751 RepID=UPI00201B3E27|nr:hypothetical protein [Aestuariirhabdus haliotis]MCL6415606.1 hypothetical protein [Aestuariirhabdus haliotis]MCL6419601.1 hypothetical protein [Aestuariirhabdus haliotis]
MLLSQHSPDQFQTRNIRVGFASGSVQLEPCGDPFSFIDLQRQRKPHSSAPEAQPFVASNLGVSGFLRLIWKQRHFLLLIQHQRPDFGDTVLKLPSGYVALSHLSAPETALEQEISEEILLQQPDGLLPVIRNRIPLPCSYAGHVSYTESNANLSSANFASHLPINYQGRTLDAVECYLHRPTNSVQLVFHWDLELPDGCEGLSLWQLEEALNPSSGLLETHWEEKAPLWLASLNEHNLLDGGFFQLRDGLLIAAEPDNGSCLSEYFLPRQGLWVNGNHIGLNEYRPFC